MAEDQKKWGAETGDCVPPGKSLLFDISLATLAAGLGRRKA